MKSVTIWTGSGSHCEVAVRYGVVASHPWSVGDVTSPGASLPANETSGRVEPEATASVRCMRWSASTYTVGCWVSSAADDIRIG